MKRKPQTPMFEKDYDEKVAHAYDVFTPEDFLIEKTAGIDIYEPTIDNIEHFVNQYTLNSLQYLGKQLVISVNLIPNRLKDGDSQYVEDASGVVGFKHEGVLIELPFIIYGGEFVPFDVIQVGNQRIPYSQANMKKVIAGITEQKRNPPDPTGAKPYIGVDKPLNPSSSIGFLGNIMGIQDQYLTKGDQHHIFAAEEDYGMKKEAGLGNKIVGGVKKHVDLVSGKAERKAERAADDTREAYFSRPLHPVDDPEWPNDHVYKTVMDDAVDESGRVQDAAAKARRNTGIAVGGTATAGVGAGIAIHQHNKQKTAEEKQSDHLHFDCLNKEAGVGRFVNSVTGKAARDAGKAYDDVLAKTTSEGLDVADLNEAKAVAEAVAEAAERAQKRDRKKLGTMAGVGIAGAGAGCLAIRNHDLTKAQAKQAAESVMKNLEKLANLKPVNESAILSLLEKAALQRIEADFEKIAAEDAGDVKAMEDIMKVAAAVNWKNANDQKNGTYIMIPELKESPEPHHTPEVSMTPAIVIDSFLDFGFPLPEGKVVLTIDQRIRILKKGDHMVCIVSDHPTFQVPTVRFDAISDGDIIVAFNGDKALFPSKVGYINNHQCGDGCCRVSDFNEENKRQIRTKRTDLGDIVEFGKTYDLTPIGLNHQATAFNSADEGEELRWNAPGHIELNLKITELDGAKFGKLDYGDFINAKTKETGIPAHILESSFSAYSVQSSVTKTQKTRTPISEPSRDATTLGVIVTDPSTKVVVAKGVIMDYLSDAKDFENYAGGAYDFAKTASSSEYVELRSRDRLANTFNLKIVYTDREKRMFSSQVKNFDNVEEYKVRGILRACGFDSLKTAELIAKAKQDNFAKIDLPENATPDAVSGVAPKSMAEDKFQEIKNVIFSPEIKNDLAIAVSAAVLANLAGEIGKSIKSVKEASGLFDQSEKTATLSASEKEKIATDLSTKAKKAAALSSLFEKVAMEQQIASFTEVAAALALSCDFMTKTAKEICAKESYSLDDVAGSVLTEKPYFEKMAFDLTALKVEEYQNGNFLVNPYHIQQAVLSISDMIDTANAIAWTRR